MVIEGNADSKWREKKLEEENSMRTVECLRGRLQAERVASKNAKVEADQLETKLIELENLLKEEAKSRNRAEKKLELLTKRLQSMNISYASDELVEDKSDFSSPSSTASSSKAKQLQEKGENHLSMKMSIISKNEESTKIANFSKWAEDLQRNNSPTSVLGPYSGNSSTTEGSSSSALEADSRGIKSHESEMGSNENPVFQTFFEKLVEDSPADEKNRGQLSKVDSNQSIEYPTVEEGKDPEYDQDLDIEAENSMALVLVDVPKKNHETIDPEVLDASVKEVLEALRNAKEQLQSSMERKRINIIRVG